MKGKGGSTDAVMRRRNICWRYTCSASGSQPPPPFTFISFLPLTSFHFFLCSDQAGYSKNVLHGSVFMSHCLAEIIRSLNQSNSLKAAHPKNIHLCLWGCKMVDRPLVRNTTLLFKIFSHVIATSQKIYPVTIHIHQPVSCLWNVSFPLSNIFNL